MSFIFNVIYLSNQFSVSFQINEAHRADLGGPLNDHTATTFSRVYFRIMFQGGQVSNIKI